MVQFSEEGVKTFVLFRPERLSRETPLRGQSGVPPGYGRQRVEVVAGTEMRPRVRDLVDLFAEARLPDLTDDGDRPASYEHGGPCGRRERTRWLFEIPDETKDDTE